jgi:hypothetical protein
MSLSGVGTAGTCANQPEHAAICALVAEGVTVVAAAGNEHDSMSGTGAIAHLPAAYPEVLTVTGMLDTDGAPGGLGVECESIDDDAALPLSNWAGSDADAAHTIAAPGGCVLSTALGGGTTTMTGTSMATPHVAGAVALCIGEGTDAGPCAGMTPAQTIATMRSTAAGAAANINGFDGDPFHAMAGKYYGHLVHASPWPRAETGAASNVGDHGAALAGVVDARGRHATWWFELGPAAGDYEIETSHASGDDPSGVELDATDLDSGTTYHYRVVVQVDGWTVRGEDATFTTTGSPPPPPPDTMIDSGPAPVTTSGAFEIHFSGTAQTAGFECRLDGGDWQACGSPYSRADAGEGPHTFEVRALNGAGKRDLTPASLAWRVDRPPPETTASPEPGPLPQPGPLPMVEPEPETVLVSAPPLAPLPEPGVLTRVGRVRVDRRHRRVTVVIRCVGATRCSGRAELQRRGRRVVSRSVQLAAGRSARVVFRLRGPMSGLRARVTTARSTRRP